MENTQDRCVWRKKRVGGVQEVIKREEKPTRAFSRLRLSIITGRKFPPQQRLASFSRNISFCGCVSGAAAVLFCRRIPPNRRLDQQEQEETKDGALVLDIYSLARSLAVCTHLYIIQAPPSHPFFSSFLSSCRHCAVLCPTDRWRLPARSHARAPSLFARHPNGLISSHPRAPAPSFTVEAYRAAQPPPPLCILQVSFRFVFVFLLCSSFSFSF